MEQTKQCSKCKEWKGLDQFSRHIRMKGGVRTICRRCNSNGAWEWNKNHPEIVNKRASRWHAGNPGVRRVHYLLNKAVKAGDVIKADACEACGRDGIRLHGHHDDYSKPLEVRWLCGSCHRAHHKAMDRGEKHEIVRID